MSANGVVFWSLFVGVLGGEFLTDFTEDSTISQEDLGVITGGVGFGAGIVMIGGLGSAGRGFGVGGDAGAWLIDTTWAAAAVFSLAFASSDSKNAKYSRCRTIPTRSASVSCCNRLLSADAFIESSSCRIFSDFSSIWDRSNAS